MTTLLDGQEADLVNKVRTLLSDPAFAYETYYDKAAYRDKVLEWAKLLAQQGIGAISLPAEYGGQDDIAKYIAT